MNKPQTLKGFRDFLPSDARKRAYVIDVLKKVFQSYGFEPLETPALEYEEILTGKYGDEGDKLMYRFEDNGGRKVAMRYDQTVPLARVVAQYQNDLPFPFKRYQIQPVWRAENTQKGRFREFLQCDVDIVGTFSPTSDAEIISLTSAGLKKLGFTKFKILINDRALFSGIPDEAVLVIDKLKKIGKSAVAEELVSKNLVSNKNDGLTMIENLENAKPSENLGKILSLVNGDSCEFSPTLARGLDYYTGLILEVEIDGYTAGSVAGGGRYDNLIGMFARQSIPAVGLAFGFDRIMDAMEQLNLFPSDLQTTKVLVTISLDFKEKSLRVASHLRSNEINTELYLDEDAKLEKQLKYADKKGIPYVLIVQSEDVVLLKDMNTREQKQINFEEAIVLLRARRYEVASTLGVNEVRREVLK